MTPHDSTHERELEELLTRDDAGAANALAARAAECARCGEEIDEFRATAATLDAALAADFTAIDRAQDEILAAARTAPLGSRDDVVEAGIRSGMLPASARRPRRGFLVPAAALSAAALALISFWLARAHSNPPPPEAAGSSTMLSSDSGVICHAPVGDVPAFDTFTWSAAALPANGESYTLIIRSLDRIAADGQPLELRFPDLLQTSRTLTARERESLGTGIEWSVRVCDAAGTATSRAGSSTSRLLAR